MISTRVLTFRTTLACMTCAGLAVALGCGSLQEFGSSVGGAASGSVGGPVLIEPYDPDLQPERTPPELEDDIRPEPALRPGDVLVFTRTEGFRHNSISNGVALFATLVPKIEQPSGEKREMVNSEDPAIFTDAGLERFAAIVFLNTTGDILDDEHQSAMERFVQAGGGFVGVHSAADTEYDWPWYGALMGAYFRSHPAVQQARVNVVDSDHPATEFLPQEWIRTDEWYDYQAPPAPKVRRLLMLDETTYNGGMMMDQFGEHPIAWSHTYDGGRAFYTGGGHTRAAFAEQAFIGHLRGGLRWVLGED
jgi:cytochrome c